MLSFVRQEVPGIRWLHVPSVHVSDTTEEILEELRDIQAASISMPSEKWYGTTQTLQVYDETDAGWRHKQWQCVCGHACRHGLCTLDTGATHPGCVHLTRPVGCAGCVNVCVCVCACVCEYISVMTLGVSINCTGCVIWQQYIARLHRGMWKIITYMSKSVNQFVYILVYGNMCK